MEENNREVGVMWEKEGQKGKYMSGHLLIDGQKVSIVVFKTDKISDKHPDWRILKSKPLEGLTTK